MTDDLYDRFCDLRAERLRPVPAREDDGLDDLRALIHVLAMAMTDGKAAT